MRPAKATMRFLPVLVLVLLAVLPAYVGSLWTGVASLALASDAPAAKPDGAAAAGQNAAAGTTTKRCETFTKRATSRRMTVPRR